MERLFDMSNEFSLLFDRFDEINELIYDVNEDGEPIINLKLKNLVQGILYNAPVRISQNETLLTIDSRKDV